MNQSDRILDHLRGGPITGIEALNLYGCFRLAARVNDLRKLGHDIATETVKKDKKSYASYHLRESKDE